MAIFERDRGRVPVGVALVDNRITRLRRTRGDFMNKWTVPAKRLQAHTSGIVHERALSQTKRTRRVAMPAQYERCSLIFDPPSHLRFACLTPSRVRDGLEQ